jgi:hypothetical protein
MQWYRQVFGPAHRHKQGMLNAQGTLGGLPLDHQGLQLLVCQGSLGGFQQNLVGRLYALYWRLVPSPTWVLFFTSGPLPCSGQEPQNVGIEPGQLHQRAGLRQVGWPCLGLLSHHSSHRRREGHISGQQASYLSGIPPQEAG